MFTIIGHLCLFENLDRIGSTVFFTRKWHLTCLENNSVIFEVKVVSCFVY